jgi:ATP-dependent DNA helicase RecG
LSNLQQNILDKLLKEPSSEEEIVREVNMEIKNDINYLISKNMISKKQYGEINIYHITGMGIETLRQLF